MAPCDIAWTIKKNIYPLSGIEYILDTHGGMNLLTLLDLVSGLLQVGLDPSTYSKTACTTHGGLFNFVCMLFFFSFCNAPATFQWVVQDILANLEWKNSLVYFDDILIVSQDCRTT